MLHISNQKVHLLIYRALMFVAAMLFFLLLTKNRPIFPDYKQDTVLNIYTAYSISPLLAQARG